MSEPAPDDGYDAVSGTPLTRLVNMSGRMRASMRSVRTATVGTISAATLAFAAMLFGALVIAGRGVVFSIGVVCIFVGIVIGWVNTAYAVNPDEDASRTGQSKAVNITVVVASVLLTVFGVFLVASTFMPWIYVAAGLLCGVLLVVSLAVLAAPWWLGLVADLGAERERAAEERLRADYAVQLHDSVLQTLAVIQIRADDPQVTRSLARSQERDLREWLYGDPGAVLHDGNAVRQGAATGAAERREPSPASQDAASTVSRAMKQAAARVEDTQGVPVDVVIVGDARMTPGLQALVDAAAEAMRNAARHGAPPISVYVEVGASSAELYVRDHGDGFEVANLPEGHGGVRDSIIERMRRAGGTASIDSRRGWGTEVHLTIPRDDAGFHDGAPGRGESAG